MPGQRGLTRTGLSLLRVTLFGLKVPRKEAEMGTREAIQAR